MKLIYGVPHSHEPPDLLEMLEYPVLEMIRKNSETEICEQVAKLNPKKIFVEAYHRGRDVSAKYIRNSEWFEERGIDGVFDSPESRIFGRLAKAGVVIEGMDDRIGALGRFHGFLISRDTAVARWVSLRRSSASEGLMKHWFGRRSYVVLLFLLQVFWWDAVSVLWRKVVYSPLDLVCIRYRDFYMGRSVALSAVEGLNVVMYGADHNPLKWVRGGDVEKHLLVDEEDFRKRMTEYLIPVKQHLKEHVLKFFDQSDIPEEKKVMLKQKALKKIEDLGIDKPLFPPPRGF